MVESPRNPGLGVDSSGEPVVDPTKNVLDLVAAAIERQDDLRGESRNLFKALLDGVQRYIDARIEGRVHLTDARFKAVDSELHNIERRRIEHKADTKSAVDAAFSAAKEAVKEQAASSKEAITKSETTVSGQIKAVEGTVDDIKDRVRTLETQQQTKLEGRVDNRSNIGMIVGVIGGIVGLLMFAIAVAVLLRG